jgi:two-component system LytT family response regulator
MTPINAIIITEEKDTLIILKKIEKENSMIIKIIGKSFSVNDGIDVIKLKKPDLIFLDIIFKDDSFLEMLNQMEFIPKLVFISAHENYAVKGFKHNAIDFILKPIDLNDIILAVDKVKKRIKIELSYQNQNIEKFNIFNYIKPTNQYVAVSLLDKIELIHMSEIIYCKASGKYTYFFLLNGKKIISSRNLGEYSNILDNNHFFRVHNSYIINLRHIVKVSKKDGYFCEFSNGINIPIAKRRQEDFNKFIKLKA